MSKIYAEVELLSGRIGRKVFESRVDALNWLKENSSKLNQAALVEEVIFEAKKDAKKETKKDPKKGAKC